MSCANANTAIPDNLKAIYTELCNSYRAIDDFRAKLLGFLPLVTGTGLFFLVTDKEKIDLAQSYLGPIGIFGFVITLGLLIYEFYGIEKCGALIAAGIELEKALNISHGQFTKRPLNFFNEPLAAAVIYPAVLGAWTFVALAFSRYQNVARHWAIGVFVAGFLAASAYNVKLILEAREAAKRNKANGTTQS